MSTRKYRFNVGSEEIRSYMKHLASLGEKREEGFYLDGDDVFREVGGKKVCYSRVKIAGWLEGLDCPQIGKDGIELSKGQIRRIGKASIKKGSEKAREKIKVYIEVAEGKIKEMEFRAQHPFFYLPIWDIS